MVSSSKSIEPNFPVVVMPAKLDKLPQDVLSKIVQLLDLTAPSKPLSLVNRELRERITTAPRIKGLVKRHHLNRARSLLQPPTLVPNPLPAMGTKVMDIKDIEHLTHGKMFHEQTSFIDFSGSISTFSGKTTAALRFPHLILELLKIMKKEQHNTNLDVLILGPGLMMPGVKNPYFFCSPQLHEILAAFSSKTNVTLVDIDRFISHIADSVFGKVPLECANKVITFGRGISVACLSIEERINILEYLHRIPSKVTQDLEIHHQNFSQFSPKKYNYIFGLYSLFYAVYAEDPQENMNVILKYLSALKEDGSLIIDERLYNAMRRHFNTLPTMAFLVENSSRWTYGEGEGMMEFLIEKSIAVPNVLKSIDVNQIVYTCNSDGEMMESSVTDIYVIKRLPKS